MSSSEVTLTVRYNLGLLRFTIRKMGGAVDIILVPTCKNFQFWGYLSFDEF